MKDRIRNSSGGDAQLGGTGALNAEYGLKRRPKEAEMCSKISVLQSKHHTRLSAIEDSGLLSKGERKLSLHMTYGGS